MFYHLRRIRAVRRQLGRDVTSKASYSTCPVASGLLQRRAGRFPAATLLAPFQFFQRVLHAAARTISQAA